MKSHRSRNAQAILFVVIFALAFSLLGYGFGKNSAAQSIQRRNAELQHQVETLENANAGLDADGVRIDRMSGFYASRDPYNPSITTDAEFRQYCQENYPNNVYSSNEWTTEEIIQSYYDTPAIWSRCLLNDLFSDFYFTWTPDYQHCFILDPDVYISDEDETRPPLTSGWLCVDGVRVKALDQATYSMDPYDLIRDYQSGEWDGSLRRSADLSTTVRIDQWDGGYLDYTYSAWMYDRTTDPLQLAYTGFAERPWWQEPEAPAEAVAAITARGKDIALSSSTHKYGWCECKLYVDLPIGYDTSVFRSFVCVDGAGTFCASATEIKLFYRGEQLDSWPIGLQLETSNLLAPLAQDLHTSTHGEGTSVTYTNEYRDNLAYVYDGAQLIALRANGETATVLEQVGYAEHDAISFWGVDDQSRLMHWSLSAHFPTNRYPVTIATDVLEANFTDLILFRKTDGCYAVTTSYTDIYLSNGGSVQYLGTEDFGYYIRLYKSLDDVKRAY